MTLARRSLSPAGVAQAPHRARGQAAAHEAHDLTLVRGEGILRAAELVCLPADNEGVPAKLAKIREGKALAPVQLVRLKRGPLIVADGYHRVSASHLLDESTPVPCVLVSVP